MSGVIESMVTVRCHQGLCPWCFSPKINLSLNASFSSLTLTFLLDEAFCLEWYLWRQTYLPNATNLSSICSCYSFNESFAPDQHKFCATSTSEGKQFCLTRKTMLRCKKTSHCVR